MTSHEITEQIKDIDGRLRVLNAQLQVNTDLEEGLELQKRHSDLTDYLKRLQSRLTTVLAQEAQTKERQEREALDAELEEIRNDHYQTMNERRSLLNQIAQELIPSAETDGKTFEDLQSLRRRYEDTYLKRFGNYGHLQDKPYVELTPEAEVVEFALDLIRNQKSGSGLTLRDVLMRVH